MTIQVLKYVGELLIALTALPFLILVCIPTGIYQGIKEFKWIE